jgi:hypothetical protein
MHLPREQRDTSNTQPVSSCPVLPLGAPTSHAHPNPPYRTIIDPEGSEEGKPGIPARLCPNTADALLEMSLLPAYTTHGSACGKLWFKKYPIPPFRAIRYPLFVRYDTPFSCDICPCTDLKNKDVLVLQQDLLQHPLLQLKILAHSGLGKNRKMPVPSNSY